VVVIEVRRPFAAADFAGMRARADDLGESALLRFGGRFAESASIRATDPASGPGAHAEVRLFALLAAPRATSFGCVSDRGPRLLLGEPLTVQEQEEIREGFVELDHIVAQQADTRIADHTKPPPEQARRFGMVQVILPRARAAFTGGGGWTREPVA
jgi:hypothetical protein